MAKSKKTLLGEFLIETLSYGLGVAIYCYCVFHFLGGWLADLYQHQRWVYASAGLALMVVQGFVLERVAHAIAVAILKRGKIRP